ncbi:ribonuclease P protein component [Candidatus Pacearchaeota archaeon]|nr:ribonuclease P protein component [Candidatus Pacearchaeota archaeon]
MLNKKNRIGNKQVIENLYRKGQLFKNQYLVFKYETTNDPSQFAVSVSKKIDKKAVKRNRIRRQIQEAIRINLTKLEKNFIVLIIARPPCQKATFDDLNQGIQTFFNTLSTNAK